MRDLTSEMPDIFFDINQWYDDIQGQNYWKISIFKSKRNDWLIFLFLSLVIYKLSVFLEIHLILGITYSLNESNCYLWNWETGHAFFSQRLSCCVSKLFHFSSTAYNTEIIKIKKPGSYTHTHTHALLCLVT